MIIRQLSCLLYEKTIITLILFSVSINVFGEKKYEKHIFDTPTKDEKRIFNITRSYLLLSEDFCQDCAAKGAWMFVKLPKSKCALSIVQNTTPPLERTSEDNIPSETLSNLCVDEYDNFLSKYQK